MKLNLNLRTVMQAAEALRSERNQTDDIADGEE